MLVRANQLFSRLLFAGDGYAFASAAGASVSLGTLTTSGQTSSVSLAAIAVNFYQALDIETLNPTEVTLYLVIAAFLDFFANATDFFFCQVLNASVIGNADFLTDLGGSCPANAVNVSERNWCSLISR